MLAIYYLFPDFAVSPTIVYFLCIPLYQVITIPAVSAVPLVPAVPIVSLVLVVPLVSAISGVPLVPAVN